MNPPHLVEVAFKGNRREFFLWPFESPPRLKTAVIVDADRGEDLGLVHATGDIAARRKAGTTHGKAAPDALRGVLRAATREEIARALQLRTDEDNVRRRAIEKVRSQGLDMKVSDTEWQWDKKKLTIYFTAEKRVDFRQLVRQLEGLFGTRVQMWHIGVRDEAKRLDGVGRCARQFCSASWLPELRPVKSSIAKDQQLSTLNPAQISGSCGRLMCCLRYEHEFYVQQRKRFPKEGKVITTVLGEEKVVANNIFREQVTLRSVTGDVRILSLAALQAELGADVLSTTAEHRAEPDDDDEGEEELLLVAIERAPAPIARLERPPRPPEAQRPSGDAAPPPQEGAAAPQPPREGRRRRRGRRGGRRGRDGGNTPPAPGEPAS
jgi:cell fate regulator YaaT (PSP1 superfamily)